MKTTIKILFLLFLLIDNIIFAQPNIEYSILEYGDKTSIDFGDFQVGSSTEGYGFITILNRGGVPHLRYYQLILMESLILTLISILVL